MSRRMYYNPEEVPSKIHLISNHKGIDCTIIPSEDIETTYPVWFCDLFRALKKGEFDEIIVTVTEHCNCYHFDSRGERHYLVGEIALSNYSDGGGYLKDMKCLVSNLRNKE